MIKRCVIAILVAGVVCAGGCRSSCTPDVALKQETVYQKADINPQRFTNTVSIPVTNGVSPATIREADGTEIKGEIRWKRSSH